MNGSAENPATQVNLSGEVQCIASNRTYHFVEMSVATTSAAINLFLCLSLIIYRRKLRQHLVNLYAANLVFANFVLIAVVTIISYLEYFGYSRDEELYNSDHSSIPTPILYFWFTLKVCTYVFFLVICVGIGLMIIAMKKNTFKVHRTVAGLSRNSVQSLKPCDIGTKKTLCYRLRHWIKKNPKRVACIQIACAWLIPIAFSTIVYHDGGACVRNCYCLMNYIPSDRTSPSCPRDSNCNLLLPSVNNAALIMGFSVWVVSVLVITALFINSYFSFRKVLSDREKAIDAQARDSVLEQEGSEFYRQSSTEVTNDQDTTGQSSIDNSSIHQTSSTRTLERGGVNFSWHHYPKTLLSESLKKNLVFLLVIALIFILGTIPFVIVTFLSVFMDFSSQYYDGLIQIPTNCIPVLSTLLNSLLLCSSHFGLNVAVSSMIRAIVQCHFLGKKK